MRVELRVRQNIGTFHIPLRRVTAVTLRTHNQRGEHGTQPATLVSTTQCKVVHTINALHISNNKK